MIKRFLHFCLIGLMALSFSFATISAVCVSTASPVYAADGKEDQNFLEKTWSFIGKVGDAAIRVVGATISTFFKPNKYCPNQKTLAERYSKCFACMTTKVLLEAFMTACSNAYPITKEAGVKLLVLGMILWFPFTVIRQVSSLTDPEAAKSFSVYIVFGFKCLVAYVFITSGISSLVQLIINPILATGADFANTFLDAGLPNPAQESINMEYKYEGPSDIISADVLNKILAFTDGVSKRTSLNMILGNGLMCFSYNAGFKILSLEIPDIWIWLVGAFVWFVGLFLMMFVSYYLLDIAFKIGFAIMALPIVIGLWPFKVTEEKVFVIFSIILKAAATYAFLSLLVTFGMVMIDQGIGGVDELFQAFEDDNIAYVNNKFSITEAPFLVFCICFLYAIKLIQGNETYASKFFPDKTFGHASPMHEKAAQIVANVKQKVTAPVSLAKDIAVHQTGRVAGGIVKGAGRLVSGVGKAMSGTAGNSQSSAQAGAGNTLKAAGQGTKAAGQGVQAAGKGVDMAGKGVQAAGQGVQAAGQGMKAAGSAMQGIPIVGNAVGAAFIAAGTATTAAGKGISVAGKGMSAAGKATQQAGKGIEKVGKSVEKGGEKLKEMSKKAPSKQDEKNKEDKKEEDDKNKRDAQK